MMATRNDDPAAARVQIDAYLGTLPDDKHAALQALRVTIAAAAPEAVEAISYGLPAFRYRGRPLVSYHAATAHCSLFPMSGEVMGAYRERLTEFDTAKGTIRFTPARPIPDVLVTAIVRDRVAEIDAGRTSR
jgi:uncharacterized protein YdhG (YjbR/CyaY superfamily)